MRDLERERFEAPFFLLVPSKQEEISGFGFSGGIFWYEVEPLRICIQMSSKLSNTASRFSKNGRWLNSLKARQIFLGGRFEFLEGILCWEVEPIQICIQSSSKLSGIWDSFTIFEQGIREDNSNHGQYFWDDDLSSRTYLKIRLSFLENDQGAASLFMKGERTHTWRGRKVTPHWAARALIWFKIRPEFFHFLSQLYEVYETES